MPSELPVPTFVRDLGRLDEPRQTHARRSLRGTEVRLARGAYVPASEIRDLSAIERYRLSICAVAATRRHEMVVSHWSAAALHGLPIFGQWPDKVHVTVGKVSGGRSRREVIKHALAIDDSDIVELDGMLVTSIARTVLDLAVYADRRTAVMAVDRALLIDAHGRVPALVSRDELWDCYLGRGNFRGAMRARAVLEFGETDAESPLESVSRLTMRTIGCPAPDLQRSFTDRHGDIGRVDFYWGRYRLVGEVDGAVKYLDENTRGALSADQVVLSEKRREDRIRGVGERVTRWPWAVGIHPQLLRSQLQQAGLPIC